MTRARLAKRLAAAILGAALLGCATDAGLAARNQLRDALPSPHAVPRPAGEAWLDAADDVRVEALHGAVLRGWFVHSRNGAAVMLVNGSGADRTQLLPEAHALSAAGYGVLVYDRPGNGESGGQKGRADERDFLRAAVDTLAAEPGVRPDGIGAYGFSSGSAFLSEAAARDPRIRAVVLAGCYADGDDYMRHYRGRGWIRGWSSLWAARWDGLVLPHPRASVPDIAPRPLLLIAGDADTTVPSALSEELYARASEPKTLWIVHGAEHGEYARAAGPEYARRLVAFFDGALLGSGGSR
jgi:alpha-beta hydrolase superfamily lysophospholipase